MSLIVGEVINGYAIESQIGSGGMGSIYLARNQSNQVAMKVLNQELAVAEAFRQRFLYEAQILSKLSHHNIAQLYSVHEIDDSLVIVMEYVEGQTLRQIIDNQGPIPEEKAIPILKQILEALNYVHQKGIIHRDVKPSNIMVDTRGVVKVMDFGIARNLTDNHLTQTGTLLGTPYYMSPEQIQTPKQVDSKSDIFSLGIVLFEMLSGRPPFGVDTDSRHEIEKMTIEKRLPDPRTYYPSISQRTIDILNVMTCKRKEDRYSCEDLLKAIGDSRVAVKRLDDNSLASTVVSFQGQRRDSRVLYTCERCRITTDDIQLLSYGGRVESVVPNHTVLSCQLKTYFTEVSMTRWWISQIVKVSGVFLFIVSLLISLSQNDGEGIVASLIAYPVIIGILWLIGNWIWRAGTEKRKEVVVISEGKPIRIYDCSLDNKNKNHVNEAKTIVNMINRNLANR